MCYLEISGFSGRGIKSVCVCVRVPGLYVCMINVP